jgi:hypothetical protein
VVASLELLGALVGAMVLPPLTTWERAPESTGVVTVGCATDNQGNHFLLDWLMTTKYPLGLMLIELAHQLSARRMALRAEWVPRLQNEEADALTNSDFRHFRAENRIHVALESLRFGVLDRLLGSGEAYFAETEAAKLAYKERRALEPKGPARRKRKGEGQRETDLWPA